MQPKGFFFNSSYSRSSVLKALFHGLRSQKDNRKDEEPSMQVLDGTPFTPEKNGAPLRDYRDQIKKAVG